MSDVAARIRRVFVRFSSVELHSFSERDKILFAARLSLFLRSGIPILPALTFIREDARTRLASTVFSAVTLAVTRGESLSGALTQFPRAFRAFDISLVRIGETTGRLHESLLYIGQTLAQAQALRAKVVGALIYPALILFATLGIVVFLIAYAFPKILPLFRGFESTLPLSTRLLIATSGFVTTYGLFLVAGMIVLGMLWVYACRYPLVRLRRDHALLTLPVLGELLKAYELAALARVLSTLTKSGVGIVPALNLCTGMTRNSAYREALHRAEREVIAGKRLTDALSHTPALFPVLMTQVVGTGELTGSLSESLMMAAEMYESEVEERVRNITTLIEPVLMVGIGLVVGFIALSIITPIYRITQDLSIS